MSKMTRLDWFHYGDLSSDILGNYGWFLQFMHIPSKKTVGFKAFITEFRDSATPRWKEEEVYGRPDPISTYSGARRGINLSWEVPAYSEEEAKENLERISLLKKMVYPVYRKGLISAPPLIKIKFMNFIQDAAAGKSANVEAGGLVGYFNAAVDFSPKIEDGFFTPEPGIAYPKTISVTAQMTILHTHEVGWIYDNKPEIDFSLPNYPYNEDGEKDRKFVADGKKFSLVGGAESSNINTDKNLSDTSAGDVQQEAKERSVLGKNSSPGRSSLKLG